MLRQKERKRNAFGFITWDFLFNPDNMQFLGATLQISFEIPYMNAVRPLNDKRPFSMKYVKIKYKINFLM